MAVFDIPVMKYGPPPGPQIMYGPAIPLYGMPSVAPSPLAVLISVITSPVFVVLSFIIGTLVYLFTKKKIFLTVPLIFAFLYLIKLLLETVFGIYI